MGRKTKQQIKVVITNPEIIPTAKMKLTECAYNLYKIREVKEEG